MKHVAYLIFLTSFLFLNGCSVNSHQQYFEAHEKAFKEITHFREHHIQRGKFQIYAREFGKKSQMPTLIMMHGFPDSMHLYDWLVPELLNKRHIIVFDFLGWGDSDKPKKHRYNFSSLEQDLDFVIDYFKLNDAVLVVHDASGPTGIDWALKHPEKTAGLVLLNTFYSPMPSLKIPEEIKLFSTPGIRRIVSVWATRISDALWIKRYNEQMSHFISKEEKREPFLKILGHQSFAIRNAFYGLNEDLQKTVNESADNVSKLKNFKKPVLIIFGNDDPYLNSGVAKYFHQYFANSKLVLVKKAGHFVQVDNPQRVAKLLQSFPLDTKEVQ